jgi:hypothetical protein
MKTGFSLCGFPHRENPFSSPGNPVMKTGFSLCGKTTQGNPCSGPVRDCSVPHYMQFAMFFLKHPAISQNCRIGVEMKNKRANINLSPYALIKYFPGVVFFFLISDFC